MDDAVEQLGQFLSEAGATVTFDSGRSISHPCTFCGQLRPPHKLMTIGTYPSGAALTRPVCGQCEPVAEARAGSGLDLTPLSPRQRDVVQALFAGKRPTEIAKAFGLSNHTVRNHLKAVNKKLGVKSQVELVARMGGRDHA